MGVRRDGEQHGKASRRKVKTDTDLKVGRERSRETWANEEKEGTGKVKGGGLRKF